MKMRKRKKMEYRDFIYQEFGLYADYKVRYV